MLHGPQFLPYACRNIRNWVKFMSLSDCLNHCVAKADCHIMETYGIYYWRTNSWAISSNSFLLHGPRFLPYECQNFRNWIKFMGLPECPNHCIARNDCHIMKAKGLYYSHTQSWAHSSRGYLLHGPQFLPHACRNIRNWATFMNPWVCLNHCVVKADCHTMETYAIFYWHTHSWALSSRCYLLHGPRFLPYECQIFRNWIKLTGLPECLNHCIASADCHNMEAYRIYYCHT